MSKEIEILEHMGTSAKFSMTLVVAPLLLIVAQLNTLIQIDSTLIRLLITFSICSFFIIAIIEMFFYVAIRHLILEQKITQYDTPSAYQDYVELVNANRFITAESLFELTKTIQKPVGYMVAAGWVAAVIVVFIAVWS